MRRRLTVIDTQHGKMVLVGEDLDDIRTVAAAIEKVPVYDAADPETIQAASLKIDDVVTIIPLLH